MITHYGLMVFLYGFGAAVILRISIQIAYALLKGNGYYMSEMRGLVISAIITVLIIINVLVVFFIANELYKLSQLSGITQ